MPRGVYDRSKYTRERHQEAAKKAMRTFTCDRCNATMHVLPGAFSTHRRYCGQEVTNFWSKVDKKANGCWEFRGVRDRWGYAHHGIKKKRYQAHRLAWQYTHGPIEVGKILLHSCDNPPCVNPAHLRLGTDADNHADMVSRGRSNYLTRSKLTPAQVLEIRAAYRPGKRGYHGHKGNQAELAVQYGVTPQTVKFAAEGKTWGHLE